MVRVFAGPGTGVWTELRNKSSVSWTESLTTPQTATIRTPVDIAPESWPAEFIIVPMRQDVPYESVVPPVYGPYDLVTAEYDSPRGTTFKCELGHHYGQLIADGSDNVVAQVVAQVEGFRRYEPFLGWARQGSRDAYEAAYGSGGDGLSYVGSRVLAELTVASSLDDVVTATAVWGFALYILVEWNEDGTYQERLAVWPRHPVAAGDLSESSSFAVRPRAGQVTGWRQNRPAAFLSPNAGLDPVLAHGPWRWQQRADVSTPEVLNSPAHFPPKPHTAAWNTRRIIAGRRSLSGAAGFEVFHTGGRVPPPAFWMDAAAPNGQLAKGVEELQRWDWQNTAAVLSGVRRPDLSARLVDVALAPHQIVEVPAAGLPRGWDPDHRQFTVRSVRHAWTPKAGYRQHVQATLWQGTFGRLRATTVTQETDEEGL